MKREDVLKLFPDATDEQVTNLLNHMNSEVAGERKKADKYKTDMEKYKTDAQKASELQARVEELENEKLTEEERRQKDDEKRLKEFDEKWRQMEQANAELKNQLNAERIKSYARSKNLTGENIDTILKSFGSNYELATAAIDSMAQLISDRESAAALAKEQEIAKQSTNPGGQSGASGNDGSLAEKMAVASAKRSGAANESILNNYRRK